MKKILLASGILAMLVSTACTKYDLYPEEYGKVLTIKDAGTIDVTVYSTDDYQDVPFTVMKGGATPEQNCTATLKIMSDEEFAEYKDNSNNLIYTQVPTYCYSFDDPTGNKLAVDYSFVGENDRYRTSTLYLFPGKIKEWQTAHAAELEGLIPVIPVLLVSDETVNELGNTTMIVPAVETPALTIDVVGTLGAAFVAKTVDRNKVADMTEKVYRPDAMLSIPCSNPWGFTVNLTKDVIGLLDYNRENGTAYQCVSDDRCKFETSYYFAPGVTSVPLNVEFDLKDFSDAELMKTFVLPLALNENSIVWDNADKNPGANLQITPSLLLFGLRMIDIVPIYKLNLNASMVTCNNVAGYDGGGVAALFDDDATTFFHSHWQAGQAGEAISDDRFGTYLEVTLPAPCTFFGFMVQNRNHAGNAKPGAPQTVHLYGSNDQMNWDLFAEIDEMNQYLPSALSKAYWGVDYEGTDAEVVTVEPYIGNDAYKYLRFCVMATGNGAHNTSIAYASTWWAAAGMEIWANYQE